MEGNHEFNIKFQDEDYLIIKDGARISVYVSGEERLNHNHILNDYPAMANNHVISYQLIITNNQMELTTFFLEVTVVIDEEVFVLASKEATFAGFNEDYASFNNEPRVIKLSLLGFNWTNPFAGLAFIAVAINIQTYYKGQWLLFIES